MKYLSKQFFAVLTLLLVVTSIDASFARADDIDTRSAALRPTSPEDARGYGEGVEVDSYPSSGGHVRVWWAISGTHAPRLDDTNNNGIPDYVELIAEVGDDVSEFLASKGWRLPLNDAEILDAPDDYGGDERFDIYLMNFPAGDGQFRPDACVQAFSSAPVQCVGHILLESKFSRSYYPNDEYAAKVVVSHEFFHAVQNAYNADFPGWWSEGSATWFEEYYFPEQSDFENLTRYYFHEPDRSLHDRVRGPADAFSYGASLFAYFLDQHIGPEGIRAVHEETATGSEILDALQTIVESHTEQKFSELFRWFKVWNVFTGGRAISGFGYPEANRFQEVPIVSLDGNQAFNWDVQVKPLAASFGELSFTRPISIELDAHEGFDLTDVSVVSASQLSESGEFETITAGENLVYDAQSSPLFLVLSNSDVIAETAVRVKVRAVNASTDDDDALPQDEDEPEPDLSDDDSGQDIIILDDNDETSSCTVAEGGLNPSPPTTIGWSLMALVGLLIVREHRARA